MSEPKVIVLTAVKNEEWIIGLFLKAMSHIADNIIVADQGSSDNTRTICKEFPKVILINNDSAFFNEPERQTLLIQTARRLFPEPRLLLTFDADDIPSGNLFNEPEWRSILQAPPGWPIMLQNVCLYGSPSEYRTNQSTMYGVSYLTYGMIDNNEPHFGDPIHTARIPFRRDVPPILLENVVSMHYQFVDKERALTKQRWYMCYERLRFPKKSSLDIISNYRWVLWDVHTWSSRPSPKEWMLGWAQRNVNLEDVTESQYFWWTWEILRYFNQFGELHFADLPIWDFDWETARKCGILQGIPGLPERIVRDPRSQQIKVAHQLLRRWDSNHQSKFIPKSLIEGGLNKLLDHVELKGANPI